MANDYYVAPTNKVPLTTIRSATRNQDAASVEAGFDKLPSELDIKRSQYGSDASSSAALYEITIPNLAVAYYEGLEVTFQALFENTGVANISVNGGTSVKIVDTSGSDIVAGSIKVDQAVTVVYVTSPTPNFQLISTAATAQDVQDAKDAADASEASAVASAASAVESADSATLAETFGTTNRKAVSLSLNVLESEVIDATNTTTILDAVEYVFDASQQRTYVKPAAVVPGDLIITVIGDQLTTSISGVHTMVAVVNIVDLNAIVDTKITATTEVIAEGQDWDGVAYVDPDAVGANPTAKIYPDGSVSGSTDNGFYTKWANGDLSIRGVESLPGGSGVRTSATVTFPVLLSTLNGATTACSVDSDNIGAVITGYTSRITSVSLGKLSLVRTNATATDVFYIFEGRWKT